MLSVAGQLTLWISEAGRGRTLKRMVETATAEKPQDRLLLKLDPGGPIELGDLTGSFAALARLYERHYRPGGEPAPKLYVTRLESGSVLAEIAPLAIFFGTMVSAMDTTMIVSDFVKRLTKGIKAFANPDAETEVSALAPSKQDAADIREFVRPLAGKKGASLGIKHARFIRDDGERLTIAEYVFDETEINRATINIESVLAQPDPHSVLLEPAVQRFPETGDVLHEVPLVFEQASRRPGKERGRTGDRGVITDVSPKPLPVYFRKSFQSLKEQMITGDVNPLTQTAFIVDVYVLRVDGEPKGYIITAVHAVIPLDDRL